METLLDKIARAAQTEMSESSEKTQQACYHWGTELATGAQNSATDPK